MTDQRKERFSEKASPRSRVLIVDDERTIRRGLYWVLTDHYEVVEACDKREALEKLESEDIDVVLCDLHLPPKVDDISDGLSIVEYARARKPPVPVVVITGSSARQAALETVRRGAYGFFQKPFDPEEIIHVVKQAARMRGLEQEVLRLRSELRGAKGFEQLVGSGPCLMETIKLARAVAETSATVLITGEHGTGKEMLARAIHEESPRANGPFVAVSCAALPESLIESELFGHEKGAFTGASQSRKGRFELAHTGTLFLDEISELTPAVQVKLLRVLQEHQFERLGSTKTTSVDIRLIAASNRDLERDVDSGRFRRDLFYRLNVVPLVLPPLRERKEDIPLLAAHFAAKAAEKHGRLTPKLDPSLVEAFQTYSWPGNVRELENLIERLVVFTEEGYLSIDLLPSQMLQTVNADPSGSPPTTLEGATAALKRQLVLEALQSEGWSKVAAAKRLGISRSYLHRLISEYQIVKS